MSQSLLDPNSNDNGSTLFKFSICNGIKEKKTNFGRFHAEYILRRMEKDIWDRK